MQQMILVNYKACINYIGKQVGSKLMKHALSMLRKDGYTSATLWVLDTNKNARAFYEKRGWIVEGKTKVDKREGFNLHDVRYLLRSL